VRHERPSARCDQASTPAPELRWIRSCRSDFLTGHGQDESNDATLPTSGKHQSPNKNLGDSEAQCRAVGRVLGNLLFVDLFNGTLSRLDLTEQEPTPTVVAGTGYDFAPGFTGDHVAATTTELSFPVGLTTDRTGMVYVVENRGQRIRRLGLVDISPGRFPNVVDLDSHRRLRVGILSTYGFDATQLDTSTLTVAGAPVTFTSVKDINGDGRPDLLIRVRTDDLQLSSSDIEAPVDGVNFAGAPFHDADWVTVSDD
jgi:hypothetical protein